jgi:hypothetical protein
VVRERSRPQRLVECLFTMEGDSGIISHVLVEVATAANGRTVYGPRGILLGLWCFWPSLSPFRRFTAVLFQPCIEVLD